MLYNLIVARNNMTTIKFAYFEVEVYTDDINYIPVNAISDS